MLSWIYKTIIRPVLFQLDPELAHDFVHQFATSNKFIWSSLESSLRYGQEDLAIQIAGQPIANPVGLAAGLDKNGHLVNILGYWGFGFAEIGSVTARPSPGNARPRLFRLPQDQALINRMGLNGEGAEAIAERLAQAQFSLPIGINIAKTNDPGITGDAAVEDILFSFRHLQKLPVRFFTINVSCPNTREGRLEEKRELAIILDEINKSNRAKIPIYIKLSPDSSDELIEDMVQAATHSGVAGYVCGNTSTSRMNLQTASTRLQSIGNGGLSGHPLKPLAMRLCGQIYKLKQPEQEIIAVGGIFNGQDTYDFIRQGANAVELYTALIYEGPAVAKNINTQLSQLLKQDKLSVQQAVGANFR